MEKRFAILGIALAAGLALAVVGFSFNAAAQQDQAADGSPAYLYKLNQRYNDYEDGVLKVRAGVGGAVSAVGASEVVQNVIQETGAPNVHVSLVMLPEECRWLSPNRYRWHSLKLKAMASVFARQFERRLAQHA